MTTLPECAKGLNDLLRPVGFKRKSSTWRRDTGEFVDVIEFQRGEWDSPRFTVNIGVLTKSAYEIAWGEEPPPAPRASDCIMQNRLGLLFGDRDRWWNIHDPASLADVARLIQELVLPFFDQMHSREAQIQALGEGRKFLEWISPIFRAILLFECGRQAEACEILTHHKWEERMSAIKARLNCPMG